jgi:RNA polymerase sigma-70 factor (ECF subfamily)
VQGRASDAHVDEVRHREIVDAFLSAARNGDLRELIAVLHPDAAFYADTVAITAGIEETVGAPAVAAVFSGRAKAAELASIDGRAGVVWRQRGTPRAAFLFAIVNDQVTAISLVMDPNVLERLDVVVGAG